MRRREIYELARVSRNGLFFMQPTNSTRKPNRRFLWVFALLVIILGALFWESFVPGYVEFSNDGPLGQQNAAYAGLPASLTGEWYDLNDIGSGRGACAPTLNTLIRWVLGPVGYSKFLVPVSMCILGLCAWTFFRQLKLTPLAALLGALAAALTSTFFSDACWGIASHATGAGMDFLALALVVSNAPDTPLWLRWTRLALAGMAVGVNVMEAADVGAIFSVFVAAFVLFHALVESGTAAAKWTRGVGRVAVIAVFALFIAAQAVVSLIGVGVHGLVGAEQSAKIKAQHWDFATQWSFPKAEALSIVVPGLFGYRLDSPAGANYWGAIGRDPSWDRYFANGDQGSPQGGLRFSGSGYYAGVLVLLVALWAIAQSLRRRNSVFSETQRRLLWFWTALLVICLPLSFGRFAPFYQLAYALPYFSTIRNPIKFLFVFDWALVVIFAYGIHGLSRRYLEVPATGSISPLRQLKNWWAKVRGFDRHWTSLCVLAIPVSLLAWLIYALEKPHLVAYLKTVGFSNEDVAEQIAGFSIAQVGWFILFLVLAVGLVTLILSGALAGKRAQGAGILLGALLVVDLARADLPWIVHWDYIQKYEVGSLDPVVAFLRQKPYEHRVAILPFKMPSEFSLFSELYGIEWSQQLFPYYDIQALDKIQMPREPANMEAYEAVLLADDTPVRHWELTNTRYLLGPAGFLGPLNDQLDPAQHRFRIVMRFDIAPKPGVENATQLSELTAVPNNNGKYALFEFTGALPRAKLYTHWEISRADPDEVEKWVKTVQSRVPQEWANALASFGTNDLATLYTLTRTNFDPMQTVLVATNLPAAGVTTNATNENSGTVEYKSYTPKDIVLDARAVAPSVLLLNDMYDPDWHVWVDGQSAPLLRCNFIMRGIYLTPGSHVVEFEYQPQLGPLYISLAAIGVGALLLGVLIVSTRRGRT
jgi:hypothetical protein